MSRPFKILKYLLIFILIALATGCAPARHNSYIKKKRSGSKVHTSQLGRNRFFFSTGYQKKLFKSYSKKK
jgi:hypothetical protein